MRKPQVLNALANETFKHCPVYILTYFWGIGNQGIKRTNILKIV